MSSYRRDFLGRIYEVVPPATFWIGVSCLVYFFFMLALGSTVAGADLHNFMTLNAERVLRGQVWQPVTYMFAHEDPMHLLFNQLLFFFVGRELESMWGTKRYLGFFFFCGVGAGAFIFAHDLFRLAQGGLTGDTLGSSGALAGLLVAYALWYPDRQILLFFVIPISIKYFVIGSFLTTLLFMIIGWPPGISHAGHLGGAIFGALFFLTLGRSSYAFRPGTQVLLEFLRMLRPRLPRPAPRPSASRFRASGDRFASAVPDHLDENRMTDKEVEAKIDSLLDVISKKGLKGLKIEEQLFLDRVSRLYRHKFPS